MVAPCSGRRPICGLGKKSPDRFDVECVERNAAQTGNGR
jgi:hypothetical protein